MSIATQLSRLTTLRNNIRTKLINLGIISDSSADLEDCYDAINGITGRTSSDLTVSRATVSVPKGYYNSAASKSVATGSATTPNTTINITPSINYISGVGIRTMGMESWPVTPTVVQGYVSSGTSGDIDINYSATVSPASLEPNLVAANIAQGVSIFGVQGSHVGGLDISVTRVSDGQGHYKLQITNN